MKMEFVEKIHNENNYQSDFLWKVNPYVRFAFYDIMKPHHVLPERIIFDYEIVYIKSGKAIITVEDTAYDVKHGDFFIFHPRQRHSFKVFDEPLIQPHVHFDLRYCDDSATVPISRIPYEEMSEGERAWIRDDISYTFFPNFPSYIHLTNSLFMEQLLFDVISAYQAPDKYPEIELKWRFMRLWNQLLNEINWFQAEHINMRKERAHTIKLYLEHHTEKKVTLDELAQVFHIDKSFISRVFHAEYKVPPIQYHLQTRIDKAKRMLFFTNIPIKSIADQTGFSSPQDFSRTFMRIEGMKPSDLRRNTRSVY